MAIEKLKTLIHIYRGDYEPYSFTFLEQNNDNETTNLNLSERFDDIRLEIRTKNKEDSTLIKQVSLDNGIELTGQNQNIINVDLTTTAKGGLYYFDMRFKLKDENRWMTFIVGNIIIESNKTKTS